MLESASGSRPSYPGYPPAAYGGLVSLVPDLNSWPSEGARLRRAAAALSKRYDPLLRHGAEGVHRLGSLGQQTGTSELPPDEQNGDSLRYRGNVHPSRTLPRCVHENLAGPFSAVCLPREPAVAERCRAARWSQRSFESARPRAADSGRNRRRCRAFLRVGGPFGPLMSSAS